MERIPEPELMDEERQARAYAEADFEEPHNRFVQLFAAAFPGWHGPECRVLDLGCGPADVTIRFARAYPDCTVHGIDGSAPMLALGRHAVTEAGMSEHICLLEGYLPGATLPASAYDAIISNSLLHHLADPSVLWQTVRRHGEPGALLFVMDLMRPESPREVERLVEAYAADATPTLRHDFRASLHAAYRPEEVAGQLRTTGLGHLNVQAVSDRHLVVQGRL